MSMAGKSSISTGTFQVGVEDLKKLAVDLKAVSPEAAKASGKRMKEAANIVAVEAQARVSQYSKTTRVRPSVRGVFSASVVASGHAAAPIENSGKGFVRHPVFGDMDVWTDKGSHPAYLAPSLDDNIDEVTVAIGFVVDDALLVVGFR